MRLDALQGMMDLLDERRTTTAVHGERGRVPAQLQFAHRVNPSVIEHIGTLLSIPQCVRCFRTTCADTRWVSKYVWCLSILFYPCHHSAGDQHGKRFVCSLGNRLQTHDRNGGGARAFAARLTPADE